MTRTLRIARREFLENVRTKAFWLGILALPAILTLTLFVPAWLHSQADVRRYSVLDRSGWLDAEVEKRAGGHERFARVRVAGGEEALLRALSEDEIFAYFVIPADPVGASDRETVRSRYVSKNITDDELREWYSGHADEVIHARREGALRISSEEGAWYRDAFALQDETLDHAGRPKHVESVDSALEYAPIVFVYVLWMSVFMVSQMLLTSMIEEKSNRIVEVLLSSVTPLQLLTGKILGLAGTGLTVIGFWAVFFLLTFEFAPLLEPRVGEYLVEYRIAEIVAEPRYLASFVVYFLLGYLLYASLLVGIGSVCNSLKEAQNLMQPVMIFLMLPLLSMIPIALDPNGAIARILSYVPTFTPFVMMNRVAGPPGAAEYVIATSVLVVAILLAFFAAAKIFRIGILMTGKPPRLREILGWLRAPVGSVPDRGRTRCDAQD